MCNFYRKHIARYSEIIYPITQLVSDKNRKRQKPIWTAECDAAFHKIKECLVNACMIAHPRIDVPITVICDASSSAIAGAVTQYVDGINQPLGFFSKTLYKREKNYTIFSKELMACYLTIKYFKNLLIGRQFQLLSDNKALIQALNNPTNRPSDRENRQLDYITSMTNSFSHIPGSSNPVADFISRYVNNDSQSNDKINTEKVNTMDEIETREAKTAVVEDNDAAKRITSSEPQTHETGEANKSVDAMTHVTSADASRQQTQGTGEACKTVDAMSDITPSEQRNRGTDNTCGVENKSVIENGNVLENKTVNIIYQQQDAIPLTEIAKEQENCKEIQSLKANAGHSLKLAEIAIDNMGGVILCDVSLEHKKARPIIPKILRRRIFDKIHDLCHPGL
ncbi:uncharacterized protein LOC120344697 isoform X2 [Styela clava]